jgi:hypothetical protein
LSNEFYTIMINGRLLASNFMKKYTEDIIDAIRFPSKNDAEAYIKHIREDLKITVIKVSCSYEEINYV